MRWFTIFMFVLAAGLLHGCGSEQGNCGWHGSGGSAVLVASGLWSGHVDDPQAGGAFACFHVNADCTALSASSRCELGQADTGPSFLEIHWSNGRNEAGAECYAGIAVTPDVVGEVPIRGTSFTIELTDTEGDDWWIHGDFGSPFCEIEARRTTDSGYCELPYPVGVVPRD